MKFLPLLPFVLAFSNAAAQPFHRIYRSTESIWIQTGQQDPTGFIMAGKVNGGTQMKVYLQKTDTIGDLLWSKIYDVQSSTRSWCILADSNSTYLVGGTKANYNPPTFSMFLMKTNDTGKVLWSKTYGGLLDMVTPSSIIRYHEDYIVSGHVWIPSFPGNAAYLLCLDSAGNVKWSKTYMKFGMDAASFVIPIETGFVLGGSTADSAYQAGGFLMQTDTIGNPLWIKSYQGFEFSTMKRISEHGWIICGKSGTSQVYGPSILKMDSSFNIEWAKRYQHTNIDEFYNLEINRDHGFTIVGETSDVGSSANILLIKTTDTGNVNWSKSIGRAGVDEGRFVIEQMDSSLVIGGTTSESVNSDVVGYFFKTDKFGNSCYSDSASITVTPLSIVEDSFTFIVGTLDSLASTSFSSYSASADDSLLCFTTFVDEVHSNFSNQISIFPNPTTGIVTIKAPLPIELVEISNAFGEKVFSAQPHSDVTTINLQSLPEGIYFYLVKTKHGTERGKIVLQ